MHQAGQALIHTRAACRNACAGDQRRHPGAMRLIEQIGPQLGLHDDQQPRPQTRKAATHAAGQIVRRIAHVEAWQQHAPTRAATRRGGGQRDLERGLTLTQRCDQDGGGLYLADRDRMHPDTAAGAWLAQPKARAAAAPVVARAQPTPQNDQARQWQCEIPQQRIEAARGRDRQRRWGDRHAGL